MVKSENPGGRRHLTDNSAKKDPKVCLRETSRMSEFLTSWTQGDAPSVAEA